MTDDDLRTRFDATLDDYRATMRASLDDLSEEEARRSLVPSLTTLLGLVKHVTFVERVWFGQAVSGRPLAELGVASTPHRSFVLRKDDTIESVRAGFDRACHDSRQATAELAFDDLVDGRGGHSVWQLYLQMLRELAQHAGHADILREQVLAARA